METSQATAAASAGIYVEDALEEQGIVAAAEGRVVAGGFAGVASDGRQLESLLYQPVVRTLIALKNGDTLSRAKATGLMHLDIIARTQVADAGRSAESVALAARPKIQGYVRMLSAPSCSRCIVLAGKFYRWNTGFQRHPRCDCRHIPSSESVAGDLTVDPKKTFESLAPAEQARVFTQAGAEAIRNGADISQVVNARRGMDTAVVFGRQVQHTREGITVYAKNGRNTKSPVRLMPEQILKEAKGNRAEAIRLLKLHGYIRA